MKIKDWCDKGSCDYGGKCDVMHFERGYFERKYYIGSGEKRVFLEKIEDEKDLGVSNHVKNNKQAQKQFF